MNNVLKFPAPDEITYRGKTLNKAVGDEWVDDDGVLHLGSTDPNFSDFATDIERVAPGYFVGRAREQ